MARTLRPIEQRSSSAEVNRAHDRWRAAIRRYKRDPTPATIAGEAAAWTAYKAAVDAHAAADRGWSQ